MFASTMRINIHYDVSNQTRSSDSSASVIADRRQELKQAVNSDDPTGEYGTARSATPSRSRSRGPTLQ